MSIGAYYQDKKIWVAGHRGMVGSALVRQLEAVDCLPIMVDRLSLDLTRQADVEEWVQKESPDVVFLAAAKVGGIHANNSFPADFAYQNLAIQTNVLHACYKVGVSKLVFLGSACMYPRDVTQPMREEMIMTGPLEPTNEAYASAKLAGFSMCKAYRQQNGADFITVLPTNAYGPRDNFDPIASHVPAALMLKFHRAKVAGEGDASVWGSGTPLREFIHADDMAQAILHVGVHYSDDAPINIGTGEEVSIKELAAVIARVVGFEGDLRFDTSKPDGCPRKLLDSTKLQMMGWKPQFDLETGMKHAYDWFLKNTPEANA